MKDLKSICEKLSDNTLMDKILSIINAEEFDDKTARRMINSVKKIDNNTSLLIDDLLTNKDIIDCKKHIVRLLKEYDSFELLSKLATDNSILFPSSMMVKNKLGNIFNLINNNFPKDILPEIDCLKELADLEIANKNISRGKFEILLRLFFTDINKSVKGDVGTDAGAIEFKVGGGRVNGQTQHSAIAIDNTIKKFLKQRKIKIKLDEYGVFHSQGSINTFFNELSNYMDVDKDVWFDLIEKAIYSQFKLKPNLDQNTRELIKNAIIPDSGLKKGDVVDAIKLTKFMGCVQLYNYQTEEKWDYITILEGNTGKDAIKNGDYICIPGKEASDIKLMFFNPNIKFDGGGRSNGAARDNYCHIYYRKKGWF